MLLTDTYQKYFGEINNELVFRAIYFLKKTRRRQFASYIYLVCLNERANPWEQFSTMVEAIGQVPTALFPQKWRFSHEKNRFLATIYWPFELFLQPLYVVTLDWHWLPSRSDLSVETRRQYGWLRMVFSGVRLFRAPIWWPSGGWRHARGREHCRGEPGGSLSGGYAPDSAKAEGSSIVDEPGEG